MRWGGGVRSRSHPKRVVTTRITAKAHRRTLVGVKKAERHTDFRRVQSRLFLRKRSWSAVLIGRCERSCLCQKEQRWNTQNKQHKHTNTRKSSAQPTQARRSARSKPTQFGEVEGEVTAANVVENLRQVFHRLSINIHARSSRYATSGIAINNIILPDKASSSIEKQTYAIGAHIKRGGGVRDSIYADDHGSVPLTPHAPGLVCLPKVDNKLVGAQGALQRALRLGVPDRVLFHHVCPPRRARVWAKVGGLRGQPMPISITRWRKTPRNTAKRARRYLFS